MNRSFVIFVLVCLIMLIATPFKNAEARRCYYRGHYDFSDAPGYGIAYHRIKSADTSWQWFGSGVDSETSVGNDPEDDGFTWSSFIPGETGWVKFTAHSRRRAGVYEQIRVWIDWNQNQIFESSECIKHQAWKVPDTGTTIKTLTDIVYFTVPTNALLGTTWLRARICCQNHVAPTGYRCQGEVEDYQVDVIPEPTSMILLGSLATGLFGVFAIRRKFSKR